jgi:hypothetical protein
MATPMATKNGCPWTLTMKALVKAPIPTKA